MLSSDVAQYTMTYSVEIISVLVILIVSTIFFGLLNNIKKRSRRRKKEKNKISKELRTIDRLIGDYYKQNDNHNYFNTSSQHGKFVEFITNQKRINNCSSILNEISTANDCVLQEFDAEFPIPEHLIKLLRKRIAFYLIKYCNQFHKLPPMHLISENVLSNNIIAPTENANNNSIKLGQQPIKDKNEPNNSSSQTSPTPEQKADAINIQILSLQEKTVEIIKPNICQEMKQLEIDDKGKQFSKISESERSHISESELQLASNTRNDDDGMTKIEDVSDVDAFNDTTKLMNQIQMLSLEEKTAEIIDPNMDEICQEMKELKVDDKTNSESERSKQSKLAANIGTDDEKQDDDTIIEKGRMELFNKYKFVYRVLRPDEKIDNGIHAKDRNGIYDPNTVKSHVGNGTISTVWISATTKPFVAVKHALYKKTKGIGLVDYEKWEKHEEPLRIIRINLEKIFQSTDEIKIINLCNEQVRKRLIQWCISENWAISSGEVIFYKFIPVEFYRLVSFDKFIPEQLYRMYKKQKRVQHVKDALNKYFEADREIEEKKEYAQTEHCPQFQIKLSERKESNDDIKPRKPPTKPEKPESMPKRPQNSYFVFSNQRRGPMKDKYPDKKLTELSKLIAQEWKLKTTDEKKYYQDIAEQNKHEYELKMEKYKKTSEYNKYMEAVNEYKLAKKRYESGESVSETKKQSD